MTDQPREVRERHLPYAPSRSAPLPSTHLTLAERASGIVGTSPAIVALRRTVERFARTDSTVLVQGETGSGKELVARALHQQSSRARMPFVGTSIVAIPSTMLVSELFGHERGAFTGAVARHRGLFEQADRSTLFLDEIGELPMDAQAALLRVLETREVRPVGSERAVLVDVRLIAATHRDLGAMVRTGAFREDLLYRLRVLIVDVPPLRARLDDLPELVAHLLRARIAPADPPEVTREALAALSAFGWPGNVRQLENVLRRMVIGAESAVLTADDALRALAWESGPSAPPGSTRSREVLRAVAEAGGNITRAARRLGVARSTVRAHLARSVSNSGT